MSARTGWSMAAVLLAAAAVPPALAEDTRAGGVIVRDPWVRETPPSAKTGAAYLTLLNTGAEADRLIGVAAEAAGWVALHETEGQGGVMKMRAVKAIDVPPGRRVVLKPGRRHVMLLGLKTPLKAGGKVPVTLVFEKAGRVEIRLEVRRAEGPASVPAGPAASDGCG